eukprot:1655915-Amphidinium_carterae.1
MAACPPPASEDYLLAWAAWQRHIAESLGLSWPPPKRHPGKHQRSQLWTELIYKQLREGFELPDGVKPSKLKT